MDGVSDHEIVIGAHTDLSGSIAIWGVGSMNGARMRFDEVNAAGGIHGRQIRFVVEDTQYQVPRAIQAANKLIHRDKIFAMLLALGTPTNNAVMAQQFKAGVPNLFPLTGARSMVEPFQELMFTQRGIYYDEIRAAVKYFVEEQDKKSICVVYQ
ncbi:MAG: ABC transporter substrate-binding protein, partial [Acidimicrobiales bacterium]|nr:ABC transporter substrate-binding protein [Acidimicrobiales bacterium]